ncbi:MAG: rhomboid family intramembrane serine protease [Blastomonas sp.]
MRITLGPITKALVIANAALWLVPFVSGHEEAVLVEGGFWPIRISEWLNGGLIPGPGGHEWLIPAALTPLSSAFLHGGLLHLAMNMLVIAICGSAVEHALGPVRYAILYLLGIYAACIGHYLSGPDSALPMVGASGAISAILAIYFLLIARRIPRGFGPVPPLLVHMAWLALAWITINLLAGLAMEGSIISIAIYAHIGGFIAGLALFLPLTRHLRLAARD